MIVDDETPKSSRPSPIPVPNNNSSKFDRKIFFPQKSSSSSASENEEPPPPKTKLEDSRQISLPPTKMSRNGAHGAGMSAALLNPSYLGSSNGSGPENPGSGHRSKFGPLVDDVPSNSDEDEIPDFDGDFSDDDEGNQSSIV